MAFNFSPIFNAWQGFTPSGLPLTGGFIYTYLAGTSTPANTYTTNVGNVPNSNPIALQADGRVPQEIWLDSAFSYKFFLTDALLNPLGTYDNITGIDNSVPAALTQWVATGLTPSYVNATTFTVAGNQTTLFQVGRRIRYTLGSGVNTGTVVSAVFGAVTTVVLSTDTVPLDGTLSVVEVSFLTATQPAIPAILPALTITGAAAFNSGATFGNATQAGVNTLDWYFKWTAFTPTLSFAGAAVGLTYTNRDGRYCRIGDVVFVRINVRLSSKGSSTGAAAIGGLPIAPAISVTLSDSVMGVTATSMTGLTSAMTVAATSGSTAMLCGQWGATGVALLNDTNFTNTSNLFVTGFYQV